MKISIDKDELYPFYSLSDDLEFGHVVDIPDEEYELLKIMEKDALDRIQDVQTKLKEYYLNEQKKTL